MFLFEMFVYYGMFLCMSVCLNLVRSCEVDKLPDEEGNIDSQGENEIIVCILYACLLAWLFVCLNLCGLVKRMRHYV